MSYPTFLRAIYSDGALATTMFYWGGATPVYVIAEYSIADTTSVARRLTS
jgi:hypothetical protein